MLTSTNMSLSVWNDAGDFYNYDQLAANWAAVDTHNHTGAPNNGVQIPTGGIVNAAITSAKIASGAIGVANIGNNSTLGVGTFSSIPSASGVPYGYLYWATDQTMLYFNNAGTWTSATRPSNFVSVIGTTPSSPAKAGDHLVTSISSGGTATIALPSSPNVGDAISVTSAQHPGFTNVTSSLGILGLGVGTSPVTSIPLSTEGASATFMWDGGAWLIVNGMQDTGWVTLGSPASPWTIVIQPYMRVIGNNLMCRGEIETSSGTTSTSPYSLSHPPLIASRSFMGGLNGSNAATPFDVSITTGAIGMTQGPLAVIYFDQISYLVD